MSDPPPPVRVRPSSTTLVIAALLYVGDAFVTGQGVWTVLVSGIAAVSLTFRWIVGERRARPGRAATLAVWCALPVLTLGTIAVNNRIARGRAEALVVAIEAYRDKHGEFPRTLEDLVPEQIAVVPRAKCTLTFSTFGYRNLEGRATLEYTSLPPFGRPYYLFNERRWGHLD